MFKKLSITCLCLCLTAATLRADETTAAALKTLNTYEKGIVTLSAVLKFELKGAGDVSLPSPERKTFCLATIIDADGLAVTSLKNLNPNVRAQVRGRRIELESQVQEVKYRLSDGTEVPARVVLQDEDLDLAFLAPLEPLDDQTKAKIAVVPLAEAATEAQVLGEVIVISRTGADLNFAPTLQLGRIAATVAQPRPCYLATIGVSGGLAFNHKGQVLGIFCQCLPEEGTSGNTISQLSSKNPILPAADISRLVPQAKEQIGEEDEEDKEKEEEEVPQVEVEEEK